MVYFFSRSFLIFGVFFLLSLVGSASTAPNRPAELRFGVLLNMEPWNAAVAANRIVGIEAALRDADEADLLHGTAVRMMYTNSTLFNDPMTMGIVQDLVENQGAFGMFAVDIYSSVFTWAYTIERGIPLISTVSMHEPMFSPISRNTFFTRVSLLSETFQMLNYALNSKLHCWKVAVLFHVVAEPLANETRDALEQIGYPAPLLVALDPLPTLEYAYNMTDVYTQLFGDERVTYRCLLVYDALEGLRYLMDELPKHARFDPNDTHILAPSVANSPFFADSLGRTETYKNVYHSQAFADPNDNITFSSVAVYQDSVRRFFLTPGWSSTIPLGLAAHADVANFNRDAYEGFIDARFLIEILRRMPSFDRSSMIDAVYNSRMFQVEDATFGPFTDRCGTPLSTMVCWCNTGSRILHITRVVDGVSRMVSDDPEAGERGVAFHEIPMSECEADPKKLLSPLNFVLVSDVADVPDSGPFANERWQLRRNVEAIRDTTISTLISTVNLGRLITNGLQIRIAREVVNSTKLRTNSTAAAAFLSEMHHKYGAMVVLSDALIPSTAPEVPVFVMGGYARRLSDDPHGPFEAWNRNTFFLDATLADHVHVASRWIHDQRSRSTPSVPSGVIKGAIHVVAASEEELELGVASLHTFQIDPSRRIVIPADTDDMGFLSSFFADAVAILFISQNHIHVAAAISFAQAHADAVIALATAENVLYDAMTQIGPAGPSGSNVSLSFIPVLRASAPNIVFASAAPPWWERSIVAEFGTAASFPDPLPYGVMSGLMSAAAIFDSANKYSMDPVNGGRRKDPEVISDVIYTSRSLSVSAVSLGPFDARPCNADELTGDASALCQCSKGPRRFFVHHISDFAEGASSLNQRTGSFSWSVDGCGLRYRELEVPFNYTPYIAGAVSSAVVLALAVGISLYLLATSSRRDNSAAPQDPKLPFCVCFTDIQASTTLWARAPKDMSKSVEQHHELIRQLIKKHKLYEVKTIGDSFMVAAKSPRATVRLAVDLQRAFFVAHWPDAIDDVYVSIEQQRREEAAEKVSVAVARGAKGFPTPDLVPVDLQEYAQQWNGMRVRVGVHYGCGNVKFDPTLLGYDYYGTVVNSAARVEGVGHGGQILITDAARDAWFEEAGGEAAAISEAQCVILDLGPQPLRGLDDPVQLFQVLPVELQARTFPPLRLDVEMVVDDPEDEVISQAHSLPSASGSQMTTESVTSYIERYAERLCRKWKGDLNFVDAYREVMDSYHFYRTLLSTSSLKFRNEAMETLSKKWRIESPKNVPKGPLSESLQLLLLVFKVKKAADVAQKEKDAAATHTGDTESGKQGRARQYSVELGTPTSRHDGLPGAPPVDE